MSEVRLVIRELERDWSGTIHASYADRAIAALSADPTTMDELEAAVTRFANPEPHDRYFVNLSPGHEDEPYDAGLVVIDLAARLVVVDSTYSSPGHAGTVEYDDRDSSTRKGVRYHLADDWAFLRDSIDWHANAEIRRRDRTAQPAIDTRQVFYGKPLLEFVARQSLAAFARRDEFAAAAREEWIESARSRLARQLDVTPDEVPADRLTEEEITPTAWHGEEYRASLYHDAIRQIHADWLLTPRDDLTGRCPRDIALDRHDHLGWDLQDRAEQWSMLGECPTGLAETSHAFQYGGFGTHELVMYYSLVRELLWSCWQRLEELQQSPNANLRPDLLSPGDFLTTEVPRLERVREGWLDMPDPEFHGRTPRSIIARERARLPEGVTGREAMVDPDCPCCQMMADMPGPAFWHLDGCNMDDDFAFDIYHRTREEWEAEQRRWEEHNKKFNAEWAERERLGVTNSGPLDNGEASIWQSSFSVGESEDVPVGIRVFGIGCHLAELIVGLRDGNDRENVPPGTQQLIDQLNHSFANVREVLQQADTSLADALIDPVIDRFVDALTAVATARPDLAEQCESLTDKLRQLLAPASLSQDWGSDDFDVPF